VGYALSALPQHLDRQIAWHRVVNANGEISARSEPHFELIQRRRLKKEGVRFNTNGRIALARFQWRTRGAPMDIGVIARGGTRPARYT
jgi:alkylated DNA nucleotide flippase Atl1